MPLTSERPGWSSISREASLPAGHVAELVLPQLHATSHVSLNKCSATRAALPGLLQALLQQQRLLAKKESHTRLWKERLKTHPNPRLPHPKMWRAKCLRASSWLQTSDPRQPAGVAQPAAALLNKP